MLFLAFPLGAQTAYQKIYPVHTDVYRAIRDLYIMQGLALPSTTGPWSGAELLMMLDRLDSSRLNDTARVAYAFAETTLRATETVFRFSFDTTLELRTHNNTENFVSPESYIRPWNYTRPFFQINAEAFILEHVYGFGIFSLGNQTYNRAFVEQTGQNVWVAERDYSNSRKGYYSPYPATNYNSAIPGDPSAGGLWAPGSNPPFWYNRTGSGTFGSEVFSHNVPLLPPSKVPDLDFSFPYRAFGAFGGSFWFVQLGRDRLSWGPGESGNFVAGDHIHYHDAVRASVFTKTFKYTMNVSGFPHPDEYYTSISFPLYGYNDPASGTSLPRDAVAPYSIGTSNAIKGLNLFIAHRVEWRTLGDRLNLVLTEGIMYQDDEGKFDLTFLSPTVFFHNIYRRVHTNSILALEADYTVMPFLNVYAQMVLDQFPLAEAEPGKDDEADPNAWGVMVGGKTAFSLLGGVFSGSAEFAYTSPYLYLRSRDGYMNNSSFTRGLNFVVANRYAHSSGRPNYVEDFLGYRWGGDAIVVNINGNYRRYGRYSFGANMMVMIHGAFDKWTAWSYVNTQESFDNGTQDGNGYVTPPNQETPTTAHYNYNYADPEARRRDAASVTTALSLSGTWDMLSFLALYGEADLVIVVNPHNYSGNPTAVDFQVVLGVTCSF